MNSKIDVLITEEEIEKRISELGEEIRSDYKDKKLTLICILKGGVIFLANLLKKINLYDIELDFMDVSSYSERPTTNGNIKINKDLENSIKGKHVLLIEDIIDTGITLKYLKSHLESKNPESLNVCVLLDKPDKRINNEVIPKYIGFRVPNKFIVGYGLDYNQKYRALPYIGTINV